jgi:KDO2-lipid IV(A) lauroyltransferase
MNTLRQFRHSIEYAAVRGALAMAGTLPLGVARAIGSSVGWVAFALGIRRDVTIDNIVRALGVSRREAVRIGRRSYQNMGRSTMEFAAFRRWSHADIRRLVRMEGVEHLQAARDAGRGVVCITGHFGSWELSGASLAAAGFPCNFVVGEQTNARVDDVMNALRQSQGNSIITRAFALKKVLTALRKNEFVALLADQDARKGGIFVDFLGRPASTVRGPALFAIRAGCPILPLSIHREGTGHCVVFEPPLWPDPSQDEETSVRVLTQHFTDSLARQIRAHPDEYFWPHRRWKTKPAQPVDPHGVGTGS